MSIIVRNTTRFQKSIKCLDGDFHYIPPMTVTTLSSDPEEEILPDGIVYITPPVKSTASSVKTKSK